ncbi:MAG: UvrD-helicase domain-containing protein [Olsenella sp.]|nr:UvrD-helicase domain-containing protein [Olsenella sp.]
MSGIDLSTLNDEQRKIVKTLDEPLFVEAGAGSGKTFTLTRRVTWALSEGSGEGGRPYLDDLSQVLVITFTNAAAREIKERVRSTLRAAGMNRHALQVDSAWISTIHGMCSRILRRHALDLGLDPEFKVVSGNLEDSVVSSALQEVVGAAESRRGEDPLLADLFEEYGFGAASANRPSGVCALVSSIASAARSVAGGYDAVFFPSPEDASSAVSDFAREYGSLLALGLKPDVAERVASGLERLDEFLALAPGKREPRLALDLLEGLSLPRAAGANKEAIRAVKVACEEAKAKLALCGAHRYASVLVELARSMDDLVSELMRKRSVLGNDDLVDLALRAVRDNPTVARDYAGRFKLVMVDEFQDTDDRQLELIGILAGTDALHLATVGDAQQSIYRFRGADVSVFRRRGEHLPLDLHVRLATNYRSHADVLALVDKVCGGRRGVLADFMHLDPNPSREDKYRARDLPRVDVEVTRGPSSNGGAGVMQCAVTAAMVADRLAEYAAHGEEAGDMALLLGAFTHASFYIDAIRARGLECVVSGGSSFTDAPEVKVVSALLHALANPKDTMSGLFPILASEMFGLDANDFVQLGTRTQRNCDSPTNRSIDRGLETMEFFEGAEPSARLVRAQEILSRARSAMRRMPVADVCLQVLRDSGWIARLERGGAADKAREANVLAAVEYIRDLTTDLAIGPARAAEEFDRWLEVSKVAPASLAGGKMRSVRVMTVHASKGLEFPVVAVAECWGTQAKTNDVISGKDADRCVCVLKPRRKATSFASTLASAEVVGAPRGTFEWAATLTQREAEETYAEKARLLYVALTRAREALIVACPLSFTKKGPSVNLAHDFARALFDDSLPVPGESQVDYGGSLSARVRCVSVEKEKADGATVWVADAGGSLPALEGVLPAAPSDASTMGAERRRSEETVPQFELFEIENDGATSEVGLWAPREGTYSYSSAHDQMARTFSLRAGEGTSATVGEGGEGPRTRAVPSRAEREAEQAGAPILRDADGATGLGSAFHELAQAMVEGGGCFPSDERIAAAKRCWHLSPRQQVRLDSALEAWWGSSLRERAFACDLVRPEVPFFARAESAYGTYVEGAIDLLATNKGSDHALLVDYKTGDRGLDDGQIRRRHEMQANFYASVLMAEGFRHVECNFVCVELVGEGGEPFVARYEFDEDHPPVI